MRLFPALVMLMYCQPLLAQLFPQPDYPQGYFRNPLSIPLFLSGNFGELRPGHYHMGLDLKTQGRENQHVFAAADGYIARIKIESGGFGRAIYINHPNGYTTLYAHLNDFNPALENWVKQQQYQQESWSIFLEPPATLFPVKKGDFIAYSGNTGGSQAPHVHFEVRRTRDDVNENPFLFGLPLEDNVPPVIQRLAVYDRTKSTYEQAPRILPVKAGTPYTTIPAIITVNTPNVSLAIGAYDMHNGSANHNGIFEATLFVDDKPVNAFRMDNISYNDTRYLNAHIDYKTKLSGGPYLQHLSELPGYINSIYARHGRDGIIDLSDQQPHAIRVEVKDAYFNKSVIACTLQYNGTAPAAATAAGKMFYPMMLDGYESDECEFYLGERCLYDSVRIRYSRSAGNPVAVSALHTIGATYIPLQESYLVRILPTRTLNVQEQQRTVMQWYAGTKKDVQKVEWQGKWAGARFRDFGNYQLVVDDEPPVIVPSGFTEGADLSKAARIVFTVKDNMGKCRNVRTELDGKWLRFTNDKGGAFIYKFDEKCLAGAHELKISVSDEAGNITVRTFKFTR